MREAVLYLPGLRGRADLRALFRSAAAAVDLDLTGHALARAESQAFLSGGFHGTLWSLFEAGEPDAGEAGLPLAALSRLGEEGADRPLGYWLCADPVCLEADRDRVVLRDRVTLDDAEARTLLALINEHLAQDDLCLEAGGSSRWYLALERPPAMTTRSLHEVLGRDIHAALPGGAEGRRWRRLLNELQMLLHDCEVNRARCTAGRLPVTGVWFWGGGELPSPPASRWDGVWGDEPVLRGLARLSGRDAKPLPATAGDWLARADAGRHLLMWEVLWYPACLGQVEAWGEALAAWQRDWLAPLLEALAAGTLASLSFHDDRGGSWRLRAWRRKKRWFERRRSFHEVL